MILYLYYLAKSFAKIGDHEKLLRLLIMIAKHVNKFCRIDRIKILTTIQ